jgi:hypothetical protein
VHTNTAFYRFLIISNKKSDIKIFFTVVFHSQLDVNFILESEFERNFKLSVAVKKLLRYQFLN